LRERVKGKTLVAHDEGDDAHGVIIKVYGEETNGAIGIIEQQFEPGLLLPPTGFRSSRRPTTCASSASSSERPTGQRRTVRWSETLGTVSDPTYR
jgi:hypothetical protein